MRLSAQGCLFLNNILSDPLFMKRKANIKDVIITELTIISICYKY